MGDSDSAAMARLEAEVEEEEVDVMELVRRLQESRTGGGGASVPAATAPSGDGVAAVAGGGATRRTRDFGFQSLVRCAAAGGVDEEAKKGQFGWFEVSGVHLPYILRGGTSYIPTKVIERSVFGELLAEAPREAVECAKVEAVTLTEAEAKLLNEINMKHAGGSFGKEVFSQRDKMVERAEFERFVTFLLFCRRTVTLGEVPGEGARCGVARVGAGPEAATFPYTLLAGARWVPLAYFEGELGNLAAGAKPVRTWDLAYLRLASLVAGGGPSLAAASCSVVRLDTVLGCYPTKPAVAEVWDPEPVKARAQPASAAAWVTMSRSGPRRKYPGKLTLIKEFATPGAGPAYKLLPAQLETTRLVGVNVKPGQWHDLLLPLPDLAGSVPGLEVEAAGALLAGRGTNLFRGNKGQAEVLESEGKAAAWDPVPLVRLGDAKKHLAALRVEAAEPASKRSKAD